MNSKAAVLAIEATMTSEEASDKQLAELKAFMQEAASYVKAGFSPELGFYAALNARLARIEARLNGEGLN